jgi:hypothetical protein
MKVCLPYEYAATHDSMTFNKLIICPSKHLLFRRRTRNDLRLPFRKHRHLRHDTQLHNAILLQPLNSSPRHREVEHRRRPKSLWQS